jgi:hypothetical protein
VRAPFGALILVGVGGALLGTGWPELNALYSFIAVVVAVFSVGAYAEPRRAAVGCALVLLTFGWVRCRTTPATRAGAAPVTMCS